MSNKEKDYLATTAGDVVSTAGDALSTASDFVTETLSEVTVDAVIETATEAAAIVVDAVISNIGS